MSEEKSSPIKIIAIVFVIAVFVGCESNNYPETANENEQHAAKSTEPAKSSWSLKFEEHIRKSIERPTGELTQEDFDKVKSIYFRHNTLDDISIVSKMQNLESFDIAAAEKVSDLSPLKGLTKLKKVVVEKNNISDLSPLKGLTELEEVHLWSNPIEDISPLLGLKKLKVIVITRTKVSKQDVEKLQKALPNCKITHDAKE